MPLEALWWVDDPDQQEIVRALLRVDCGLLVPAAQPDVVTMRNVDQVTAHVVLEGANIAIAGRLRSRCTSAACCASPTSLPT